MRFYLPLRLFYGGQRGWGGDIVFKGVANSAKRKHKTSLERYSEMLVPVEASIAWMMG